MDGQRLIRAGSFGWAFIIRFGITVQFASFRTSSKYTVHRLIWARWELLLYTVPGSFNEWIWSVADLDPHRPGSGSRRAICPTKIGKKWRKISCSEVLDVLMWRLRTFPVPWTSFLEAYDDSKLQYLLKIIVIFPRCKFFQFLSVKTLDPGLYPDPY
jgi:hypothetical protein